MTVTASTAPATMARYPARILLAITTLSLAACGSSHPAAPPAAAGSSSTAPAPASSPASKRADGKDQVGGLISSVTGSTIAVTAPTTTATVAFSPATKISEVTSAQLTDITVGSCVSVRPARDTNTAAGTPVTAAAVLVSSPVNGQCFTGARPSAAGSPTGSPPGPAAGHRGMRGTVASVTSTVADGATAATTVDLTDTTTYTKRATADPQAIAQGKCLSARGSTDSTGTLQATAINLRPADNGRCPPMNR